MRVQHATVTSRGKVRVFPVFSDQHIRLGATFTTLSLSTRTIYQVEKIAGAVYYLTPLAGYGPLLYLEAPDGTTAYAFSGREFPVAYLPDYHSL